MQPWHDTVVRGQLKSNGPNFNSFRKKEIVKKYHQFCQKLWGSLEAIKKRKFLDNCWRSNEGKFDCYGYKDF